MTLKPRKLQQFYILKFTSGRLRDYHYNIDIGIDEAIKNNELVSIGESQVIRSLKKIKNEIVDKEEIGGLFKRIRVIKNKRDSEENIRELLLLNDRLNEILFLPEIISVEFENKTHYKKIIKDGLTINGKSFTRFLAGSGNLRKNTVFFCEESISSELIHVLENGYDKEVELVPSKLNAYFALSNSATYEVSFPIICVVPDRLEKDTRVVDYVVEADEDSVDVDDEIEEREVEIEMNYFDGQGVISPRFAKKWADELGLDFLPSSFIIRSSFLKGMVCVFDFHDFSKNVAKERFVVDVWGNKTNIEEIDVILTTSQFKLWYCYESIESYMDLCKENSFGFGVSRFSPKDSKTSVFSNYQFNQVLALPDDEQIEGLCKPTIEWFESLFQKNPNFTILYFLGDMINKKNGKEIFEGISDPVAKALILNKTLIDDPYIQKRIENSVSKKIREGLLGSLLHTGNFSTMISDPYAFCEHVFSMEIKGLLSEKKYYSSFWNGRGVDEVAAMRAPLTHQSEVNILSLKNNRELRKWYKHLSVGVVYPVFGIDCLLHADSDFDGDIVMTTDQKEIINGAQKGRPICYDSKNTKKKKVKSRDLSNSDMKGFNSRIGFITNISSSYHSKQFDFEKGSKEFEVIEKRLKLLRFIQGSEIDRQKGILTKSFPDHWVKFRRETVDSDISITENNKIVVKKRPYFFRYLYEHYNRKFKKHYRTYENYFMSKFGKDFGDALLDENPTEEENEIIDKYKKFSPFINSDSTMNRICWHMEKEVKRIRGNSKVKKNLFENDVLLNKEMEFDPDKYLFVKNLYEEYKKNKKSIRESSSGFKNIKIFCSYIRRKALEEISNERDVATYAVMICYEKNGASKDFAWNCFSDGMIDNIRNNTLEEPSLPLPDTNGFFEYMGRKFSIEKIKI